MSILILDYSRLLSLICLLHMTISNDWLIIQNTICECMFHQPAWITNPVMIWLIATVCAMCSVECYQLKMFHWSHRARLSHNNSNNDAGPWQQFRTHGREQHYLNIANFTCHPCSINKSFHSFKTIYHQPSCELMSHSSISKSLVHNYPQMFRLWSTISSNSRQWCLELHSLRFNVWQLYF